MAVCADDALILMLSLVVGQHAIHFYSFSWLGNGPLLAKQVSDICNLLRKFNRRGCYAGFVT
jgi:hypothetical protein